MIECECSSVRPKRVLAYLQRRGWGGGMRKWVNATSYYIPYAGACRCSKDHCLPLSGAMNSSMVDWAAAVRFEQMVDPVIIESGFRPRS